MKKKIVKKKVTKKKAAPIKEGRDGNGRFVKGHKGNPDGRPKNECCIPVMLRLIGDEVIKKPDGTTMTKLEKVLHTIYDRAIDGNQAAVDFIAQRTEGKVADKVIKAEVQADFLIED